MHVPGVSEEELTKNYIKLVIASQMGQGIMPNAFGESRGISSLKLSGNPAVIFHLACSPQEVSLFKCWLIVLLKLNCIVRLFLLIKS